MSTAGSVANRRCDTVATAQLESHSAEKVSPSPGRWIAWSGSIACAAGTRHLIHRPSIRSLMTCRHTDRTDRPCTSRPRKCYSAAAGLPKLMPSMWTVPPAVVLVLLPTPIAVFWTRLGLTPARSLYEIAHSCHNELAVVTASAFTTVTLLPVSSSIRAYINSASCLPVGRRNRRGPGGDARHRVIGRVLRCGR